MSSTRTARIFGAPPAPPPRVAGLPADALDDAVDVAEEGRLIASTGIRYRVDGIIPDYGMLGFLVAYAKVGKTTFGQALGGAVACGAPFLGRATQSTRVLVIAAEDPPEYTAWLARHLDVPRGQMSFVRQSWIAHTDGLADVVATVAAGQYGFVLIASWQAVVRGLIKDENDNAGAVAVVENVKVHARASGVPWLIDAHSGKGEDQTDDADPLRALRGASSAAGAADFMLSLRYANGTFGTQRRISGKGRFVSLAPLTFDWDRDTNTYSVLGAAHDVGVETTWRMVDELGALDGTPRTLTDIGKAIGWEGKLTGGQRKQLRTALQAQPSVFRTDVVRRGQKTAAYWVDPEAV